VPVEVQTSGGNISRLVSGFPNFDFEEIDGTDPVVAYAALKRANADWPTQRAPRAPG
jgi:2-oxoisovalerate dehydrogenase E1 component